MKKILVLNGPNLNLLGKREPALYGSETLSDINQKLTKLARDLNLSLNFKQSNHEGVLVDALQSLEEKNYQGAILNAAAFTHTSLAIRDAILAISKPVIEVHLTNPMARESFRQVSFLSGAVKGSISGFGSRSYELAVYWFAGDLS
jgi:3-dehydroquinate dehydratase-2